MKTSHQDVVADGIMSKVERYNWTVQDEPGTFAFLRTLALIVDDEYQRQANDTKVKSLAREWSWIACGVIAVGERDGDYYVIDGQHRVLAARRRADIKELPCIIFRTEGAREEAHGFLRANTMRKPVTAIEKFKALTVTEDKIALHAQRLVAESGRVVSGASSPTTIRCIGRIQHLISVDSIALERIWPLLVRLCSGHVFHDRLLEAFFYIEKRMPEAQSLSDKDWTVRILRVGFERILEAANRGAAFYARGGARAFATGIVEELNKRCRTKLELRD